MSTIQLQSVVVDDTIHRLVHLLLPQVSEHVSDALLHIVVHALHVWIRQDAIQHALTVFIDALGWLAEKLRPRNRVPERHFNTPSRQGNLTQHLLDGVLALDHVKDSGALLVPALACRRVEQVLCHVFRDTQLAQTLKERLLFRG